MKKVKSKGLRSKWTKCCAFVIAVSLFGLCCTGLAACGHTHSLKEVKGVAATCLEGGSKAYWTCDDCGGLFSDAKGATATTLEETFIAAKGHALTKINRVDATCLEGGIAEHWKCSECNSLFSDADGATATTSEETFIAAKGHTLTKMNRVDATCFEGGVAEHWKCSDCDSLFLDADGATATTLDAIKTATAAHEVSAVSGKAATCTETGNVEHWKCNHCGALFSDAAGTTATTIGDVTVAKLRHNYALNVEIANKVFLEGTKAAAEDLTFTLECADCDAVDPITEGVTVDLTADLVLGENTFTASYAELSLNKTFTVTAVSIDKLSITDSKVSITNADGKKVGLKTENGHTFLSGSPNDYYGRMFIRYNLSVDKDTEANLYLNMNIRTQENKMNDVYSIKVNGQELVIGDDVKLPSAEKNDWFAQSYACAGTVTLLAGQNNVIEITRKNLLYFGDKAVYGNFTYNFFGMGIATSVSDTLITYNQPCADVCVHCGKCTNADSLSPICADKCAGHVGEHFCESICTICGACKDGMCQEDACAQKDVCKEFTVMDQSVTAIKSDGGIVIKNDKEGEKNISANDSNAKKGMITITYTIHSDVAIKAKLYIKTCSQTIQNFLADSYAFKVGNEPVTVDGSIKMPYNEANKWKDIRYTFVGEVNLIAGANTIEIVRPDMTDFPLNNYTGFNFFGIALSGAANLTFPA